MILKAQPIWRCRIGNRNKLADAMTAEKKPTLSWWMCLWLNLAYRRQERLARKDGYLHGDTLVDRVRAWLR